MFNLSEGPAHLSPKGVGRGKSARLLREARGRAGLSQTELADRVGMPIQTINRIEHALVDPRLGTVERLLTACGWTLAAEPLPTSDRTQIRVMLDLDPLSRLSWRQPSGWSGRIARLLRILRARGIRFLVVGSMAERLQGAPVPIQEPEIRVANDHNTTDRLWGALHVANKRFQRVEITVVRTAPAEFEQLLWSASHMDVMGSRLFAVRGLQELIAEAPPDRAELLRCVREEQND